MPGLSVFDRRIQRATESPGSPRRSNDNADFRGISGKTSAVAYGFFATVGAPMAISLAPGQTGAGQSVIVGFGAWENRPKKGSRHQSG